MRFRRQVLIGVVLLVVMTAGMATMAVTALRASSTAHERLSRRFAADLLAAERLRSLAEEMLAVAASVADARVLGPWLSRWTEHARLLLVELRERNQDRVGRSQLREIERSVQEGIAASRDARNIDRMRGAHVSLEAKLTKFIEREASLFDQDLKRVREATSRDQISLVLMTILILGAGISIAFVTLRRLGEVFRAEQAATETAQREAAARREVLAIVSHDLRTPLSTIAMSAELLDATLPDTGEPRGPSRQVQMIRNAADRMTNLIDEVLDTARIEAGTLKLHLIECDVGELLETERELFELRAAVKSITLRIEPPEQRVTLKADPERILQVLSNLMSNALKFTPAGGEIISRAEAKDDHVLFTIRDTGPGIPPAQRAQLFDRYWQAPGSDHRGSLGLGLFICRSLVEAHGGKIWIEQRPGGGSQFCFTIPHG
jgi:signal transduction histidine kinase